MAKKEFKIKEIYLKLVNYFVLKIGLPAILLVEKSFLNILKKKKHSIIGNKGDIIIIGGGFINKGSQAMTFTVVNQMKRRFPNKKIYLLSSLDFERKPKEKKIYNFKILPWNRNTQIALSSFWFKYLMVNFRYDYLINQIKTIVKNADFMINISGFGLSSYLKKTWISHLLNIMIAKKYDVPYFIFPQSMGPFNFPLKDRIFFYPLAKLYLNYPKKIFIREKDGLRHINRFKKANAEKAFDIVLQNKRYNISNIFKENINFKDFQIKPNSVCIIPNKRVKRINANKMYSIYYSLIKRLIEAKKTIYILKHADQDSEICRKIKNLFQKNKNVNLILENLNVFEFEKIVKKFDFIITSRYHSIVHAYKNGIPALVIGWAVKYFELLELFGQSDYYFDIRCDINIEEINQKLELLIKKYKSEKKKIQNILINILKKKTCFEVFDNIISD